MGENLEGKGLVCSFCQELSTVADLKHSFRGQGDIFLILMLPLMKH